MKAIVTIITENIIERANQYAIKSLLNLGIWATYDLCVAMETLEQRRIVQSFILFWTFFFLDCMAQIFCQCFFFFTPRITNFIYDCLHARVKLVTLVILEIEEPPELWYLHISCSCCFVNLFLLVMIFKVLPWTQGDWQLFNLPTPPRSRTQCLFITVSETFWPLETTWFSDGKWWWSVKDDVPFFFTIGCNISYAWHRERYSDNGVFPSSKPVLLLI